MNNVVTNYTYGDAWGNLTQVVQDPGTGHLNRTTSMVYDSGGRVTQSADPSGYTSTFSYNNLGQPTQAVFPATANTPSETVSYSYGSNGRLNTVTDNRGTTTLAYESTNDRVASVTDPVTGAISYSYRLNGARSTMSLPGGGTWTYAYHALDSNNLYRVLPKDDPNAVMPMLETITDDQGRICEYRSDIVGNLREVYSNQIYDGGGNRTAYCYSYYELDNDGQGRTNRWLKKIKHLWNWTVNQTLNQKTLTQNIYTYNNAGMRTANSIYDQNGLVRTESYGYDELYRLNSVNYGDGQTQSYAFDSMGNRSQKVDSSTGTENYTYNAANMLLTRGANNYTNDSNGNTLNGGGRTNIWDSQNRLAQCTYNGTTSNFTYASDGIRHRSVVGANTTDYVLDGTMFVRDNLNSTVNATYLVGLRGPEYRRDITGTIRWYVCDGLGSVLGEVDPNGNLTASRSHDVYGAVRTSAGTSTSKHKFVGNLGHPSDDETGLIYMQARYMDPVAGRFVGEDPAKDGPNLFDLFLYCDQNPVNKIDADGKDAIALIELGVLYLMVGLVLSDLFRTMIAMIARQFRYGDGPLDAIKGMVGVLINFPRTSIFDGFKYKTLLKHYGPLGSAREVVAFYTGYAGVILIVMGLLDLELERM